MTFLSVKRYVWGSVIIGIVIISGCATGWKSYKSKNITNEERASLHVRLLHFLLFGPLYHMWKLFKSNGDKNVKKNVLKIKRVEAILESGPQV